MTLPPLPKWRVRSRVQFNTVVGIIFLNLKIKNEKIRRKVGTMDYAEIRK